MLFNTELIGDIAVIKVNIDRATFRETENLKKVLSEYLGKNINKFVIDFSKCDFMDSTFLSTVVSFLKKSFDAGGNLVLANIHSEAQSLIELTGTDKIFQVYNSLDEAVKSFDGKVE